MWGSGGTVIIPLLSRFLPDDTYEFLWAMTLVSRGRLTPSLFRVSDAWTSAAMPMLGTD